MVEGCEIMLVVMEMKIAVLAIIIVTLRLNCNQAIFS